MKKHLVICDKCKAKLNLKYNGEHFLVPQGWIEFYDENKGQMMGIHLCEPCSKDVLESSIFPPKEIG